MKSIFNTLLRLGATVAVLRSNLFDLANLSVERVYVLAEKKVRGLAVFLTLCLGVPILIASAGCLLGWFFGEYLGIGWAATLASVVIKSAGFLCAIGLVWVWIRATVYAHLLYLAGRLGSSFISGFTSLAGKVLDTDLKVDMTNPMPEGAADKFAAWLRNTVAWASLVCLIAMVVPIWRFPVVTAILTVAIIVLAMFMGKVQSLWPTRIAVTSAIGVAVYTALLLSFPVQVTGAEQWFAGVTGADKQAERVLLQGKIDELDDEDLAIMARGLKAEKSFESPEDEARHAAIQILKASYQAKLNGSPAPVAQNSAPTAAPPPAQAPAPAPEIVEPAPTATSELEPLPPAEGVAALDPPAPESIGDEDRAVQEATDLINRRLDLQRELGRTEDQLGESMGRLGAEPETDRPALSRAKAILAKYGK